MQAQTVEAVRQAASEAGLQVIEDAYDSRLKVIELAIESLKLSLNENRRGQQQGVNREEEH